jgi:probable F420-dependent oxidoreductase
MMKPSIRPFRFGIFTGGAPTKKEWIEKVRKTEDLGYNTLLFGDHLFYDLTPVAAIMSGADATTSLRFGSYMFGNDFRHPLLLAKEAATLDVLSDGRLELGIGSGYWHQDYTHLGIPLDPPGKRIDRLEEALKIIKSFFAGKPFSFQGKHYTVEVENTAPVPVQSPHPPIAMGGGGRRMISLAAREADHVSINLRTTRDGMLDYPSVTAHATQQKLEWFCQAAGDRIHQIELSALVTIHESVEQFYAQWGTNENQLSPDEVMNSPHALIGSEDAMVEKLLANRERFGISHFIFFEPIEASAGIVKRLSGL